MKNTSLEIEMSSFAAPVAADVRRLKLNSRQRQSRLEFAWRIVGALLLMSCSLAQAATITWDGGGGDLSWQNRFNWSGDQVPGPSDDAVINVPANVTILCDGDTRVRSVQCQGGLRVSYQIWVTGGSSFVDGIFTTPSGASLIANGSGAVFVARGPTQIEGGLYAMNGATLILTNVASMVAGNSSMLINAMHGGSLVDLSQVTNVLVMPPRDVSVNVQGGGRVDLSRARITGYGFSAFVSGAGSVADLSGLAGEWCMTSPGSVSGFTASDGGTVLIPNVTGLTSVQLTLTGTNGTPTAQLRTFRQGSLRVSGVAPDFSSLTNIDGSRVVADGSATLNLSKVTAVTGGPGAGGFSVNANGGAAVLLTNLTTLVVSNGNWELRAGSAGGGGLLDLSRVTNIVVAQFSALTVSANNGGRVDLQRVESIMGGTAFFLSDGAGSVIDLSRLSGFLTPVPAPHGASSLTAPRTRATRSSQLRTWAPPSRGRPATRQR